MTELPLFPLTSVLLPYGRMPLQIFEQRYLDLVRECMRESSAFGVVWIRRGSEVAQRGSVDPDLGDYGTVASIIDWDQLDNGLLGITIEGGGCFQLRATHRRSNGLVIGSVDLTEQAPPSRLLPEWQSLADLLRRLGGHPHVERMNLQTDFDNAWEVAYTLIQLLPLEESLKYELLGETSIDDLVAELDGILKQISGTD